MAAPIIPLIKYLLNLISTARGDIGDVETFAGDNAPPEWLECNGRALESPNFPNLFAVIGTSFGDGSAGIGSTGSTDFNIPDMRGQFARGYDNSAGNDLDAAVRVISPTDATVVGDVVGSYQASEVGPHTRISARPFATGGGGTGTGMSTAGSRTFGSTGNTGTFGTEARPVNISLMYIIKE